MGSPAVAAWIAHGVFWLLIVVGWSALGLKRRVVFLALWLAAFVGRSYVPYGELFFAPYVAVLDIILVFIIFRGDVRLY